MQVNLQKASQSIIQISDIMPYVTYEATADFVPVEKEINYLNGFIELQKLLFGENFIRLDIQADQVGKMIAPMLFIPLDENAIKHGDKKNNMPAVQIETTIDSDIHYKVMNPVSMIPVHKDMCGGLGLKNLKCRLELIYPGRHILNTNIIDHKFIAELWIH